MTKSLYAAKPQSIRAGKETSLYPDGCCVYCPYCRSHLIDPVLRSKKDVFKRRYWHCSGCGNNFLEASLLEIGPSR